MFEDVMQQGIVRVVIHGDGGMTVGKGLREDGTLYDQARAERRASQVGP